MKTARRHASLSVFKRSTATHSTRLLTLAASFLLVACAGAGAVARSSPPYGVTRGARLGIVEVTRNDLSAASTGSSLYSAIRYLSPVLLAPHPDVRGVPSSAISAVYVNGIRVGGLETLETIPSYRVRKVEFLPADDRRPYGFRYEPGAILVTLITDRP